MRCSTGFLFGVHLFFQGGCDCVPCLVWVLHIDVLMSFCYVYLELELGTTLSYWYFKTTYLQKIPNSRKINTKSRWFFWPNFIVWKFWGGLVTDFTFKKTVGHVFIHEEPQMLHTCKIAQVIDRVVVSNSNIWLFSPRIVGEDDPNLIIAKFSNGLKPPTSYILFFVAAAGHP